MSRQQSLLAIGAFASFLAAATVQITLGQTSAQGERRTVADCLTTMQQYPAKQAEAARKAGQQPNYRLYRQQAKELGKQCAAGFKIDEVKGADLATLAKLNLATGQPALAREAINRRLKPAKLSEAELAESLNVAIEVVISGTPSNEDLKLGEAYTAEIDALSTAQLKQKIEAHGRLAGYYSYHDIDEPNLAQHLTIIKLIDQLPAEERKSYADRRADAYGEIARVEANRGQVEKAIATLRQGKAEVTDREMAAMFDESIERYYFVGHRVPPLNVTYWIGNPASLKQLDPAGHVTLIQFTAHWCGPCRQSYPGMLDLYEKFSPRGLDVMLATSLYGYFEDRENLKPDEEVAADREYYTGKYKLPFKIAIEPRINYSDRTPAGEAARRETNEFKYHVGAFPQIMILDKQGIVRHILMGWDPANEKLVSEEIDRLLKEPATTSATK